MRDSLFLHIVLGFSLDVIELTIIISVLGIFLIIAASSFLKMPEDPEKHRIKYSSHYIVRDMGIAFLVAAIVTVVYGSILDFKRVSDAISMMIGENVPQSVWNTTEAQLFHRDVF